MIRPGYILGLLLALTFSLATSLQPEARSWRTRTDEGGLMGMLFGDGRRLFANHFTAKADQYFHSGFYPSIFDQRPEAANASPTPHVHDENCQHETAGTTGHVDDEPGAEHDKHSVEACDEKTGGWDVGQDLIARFGRNFRVTEHTHLEGGQQRELLPWLKISAELDPHQISTYLVASYWLRRTDKSLEAEKFIRQGLEANPQNCELLFELGQIYSVDRQKPDRAQHLFEMALTSWEAHEQPKEKPDLILLANIASHLSRIEEAKGQYQAAIGHLERARQASPHPEAIAKQIEELKVKLQSATQTNSPSRD